MLTEEQYLTMERAAEFRHEFFDGEMLERSGVSIQHAGLQANISGELYDSLRGTACKVLGSCLRVRASCRMYSYPDLSVVCGKPLLADEHQDVLLNPIIIFEVFSAATESFDRGRKFQQYRAIVALQDYILVSQTSLHIEQYTRHENNLWTVRDYETLDDVFNIPSIGVSLSLRAIYNRVEFPAT